jgi:hypothetical protein
MVVIHTFFVHNFFFVFTDQKILFLFVQFVSPLNILFFLCFDILVRHFCVRGPNYRRFRLNFCCSQANNFTKLLLDLPPYFRHLFEPLPVPFSSLLDVVGDTADVDAELLLAVSSTRPSIGTTPPAAALRLFCS